MNTGGKRGAFIALPTNNFGRRGIRRVSSLRRRVRLVNRRTTINAKGVIFQRFTAHDTKRRNRRIGRFSRLIRSHFILRTEREFIKVI